MVDSYAKMRSDQQVDRFYEEKRRNSPAPNSILGRLQSGREAQKEQYTNFMEDQRARNLQSLKNRGLLNVEKTRQAGGLATQERAETGATKRTGMTEQGLLSRLGQTQEYNIELEKLRHLNQLGVTNEEQRNRLAELEKMFELEMKKPVYKEVTSSDALGNPITSWIDVRKTLGELEEIDALGGTIGGNNSVERLLENQVQTQPGSSEQTITQEEEQTQNQNLIRNRPGRTERLNQALETSKQESEIPIVKMLNELAEAADPEAIERRKKRMLQSFGGGRIPYTR